MQRNYVIDVLLVIDKHKNILNMFEDVRYIF